MHLYAVIPLLLAALTHVWRHIGASYTAASISALSDTSLCLHIAEWDGTHIVMQVMVMSGSRCSE